MGFPGVRVGGFESNITFRDDALPLMPLLMDRLERLTLSRPICMHIIASVLRVQCAYTSACRRLHRTPVRPNRPRNTTALHGCPATFIALLGLVDYYLQILQSRHLRIQHKKLVDSSVTYELNERLSQVPLPTIATLSHDP
jgi:hypothetical protein